MYASAALTRQRALLPPAMYAELVLVFLVLAGSAAVRLHDLEGPRSAFPDLFDEGIRAAQLLLMAEGYRPFRDIYAAQGLLLLDLLYPFYALFGGTLGAIRLGVGVLSLVGLAGIWWVGRLAGGRVGGLAALFLLAVSPAYLEASRLALAEVPSLTPAIWALGCALCWQRGGSERWLYAAAALGTIGVLVKPMVIAVAAPLALLVLLRSGLQLRHLAISLGISLSIVVLSVLALGPVEVYEQIVQYRVGARQAGAGSWELRRSYKEVLLEPFREHPGLFVMAAVGGLLLVVERWRRGLALVAWPLATIGMMLVYYPLHPKHLVYLYPPLALVAGAGLGRAAWLAWKDGPSGRPARLLTVGVAAVLAATTIGSATGQADRLAGSNEEDDADLHVFDRAAVRSIQLLTDRRDFILTDHPYIAALAYRPVPPNLVDPSRGRTRAGTLTDRDAIEAAEQFDTQLVLIWADRLRRLSGVPPWLDQHYVLSHVFGHRSVKNPRGAKDRSIYLRGDTDLAAARARLESGLLVRETAEYGGVLRLLGAAVSTNSLAAREHFTVTLGWLALAPMSSDYHITMRMVDEQGKAVDEQEHDLEGSARGTSTWQPGRWLFRTFAVQPEQAMQAGQYRLQISVVDPKPGKTIEPRLASDARQLKRENRDFLTVGTVEVR